MKLRQVSTILVPIAAGLAGFSTYLAIKDARNYKGVNDLKIEIAKKIQKIWFASA